MHIFGTYSIFSLPQIILCLCNDDIEVNTALLGREQHKNYVTWCQMLGRDAHNGFVCGKHAIIYYAPQSTLLKFVEVR